MSIEQDDVFEFAAEDESSALVTDASDPFQAAVWPILIVDDEAEVHRATRFALSDAVLLGLPLELDSAYSAQEARERLRRKTYACVLLDVVMESEEAGLHLVEYIREILQDHLIRIILRTGQPGYAPEIQVIERYDINDYKNKSELTVTRLSASLIASLRTYEQLKTIDANRQGLELILNAASNLLQKKAVQQFARGALMQVCGLLKVKNEGFIWGRRHDQAIEQSLILSAVGQYQGFEEQSLSQLTDHNVQAALQQVLTQRASLFKDDASILYIPSPHGAELVVHVRTTEPLTALDRRLLELFCINLAVGFDNAALFEHTERLAFVDPLTGIANRTSFENHLTQAIANHARVAVLLLDIDNFQAINDGLGHAIGDKVLQYCPALLQTVFADASLIARFGPDIFALVYPDITEAQLNQQLMLLTDLLTPPLTIQQFEIPLSLSIGIALYPVHEQQPMRLVQKANIALKQAKAKCRGSFEFFDPAFEQSLIQRLQIISDLHQCIERNELRLHYQPKLALANRRIKGVEALVRWQQGGHLVSPCTFIPAAEGSGQIVAIGEWVLREACRQQVEWRDRYRMDLQVAVNVSVRQLYDPLFLQRLQHAIDDSGIACSQLELEVTESVMGDEQCVIDVLRAVSAMGVEISIDDFGTGYSSLSALKSLPVNRLKIDQSFVRHMEHQAEYAAIVDLIINMAGHLNLGVIAEGVETEYQERLLISMGCADVQGYRYAKPLRADDIVSLFRQYNLES